MFHSYRVFSATAAMLTILGSHVAHATSPTLILQGVVPTAVNLVVTGSGNYSSIDFSQNQTNTVVATIVEQSNSPSGYTVSITSANQGLKNGSNTISYTARYDGTAFNLTSSGVVVHTVNSQTGVISTAPKNLDISLTGAPFYTLNTGTYTDTLTFTIAAN